MRIEMKKKKISSMYLILADAQGGYIFEREFIFSVI